MVFLLNLDFIVIIDIYIYIIDNIILTTTICYSLDISTTTIYCILLNIVES